YDGDISETIDFFRRQEQLKSNWEAGKRLVEAAEHAGNVLLVDGSGWARTDIEPSFILNFLSDYREHPTALRVVTKLLADYIKAENVHDRLVSWSVMDAVGSSHRRVLIPSVRTPLVQRAWHLSESNPEGKLVQKKTLQGDNHYRIRRLVSPTDERVDL